MRVSTHSSGTAGLKPTLEPHQAARILVAKLCVRAPSPPLPPAGAGQRLARGRQSERKQRPRHDKRDPRRMDPVGAEPPHLGQRLRDEIAVPADRQKQRHLCSAPEANVAPRPRAAITRRSRGTGARSSRGRGCPHRGAGDRERHGVLLVLTLRGRTPPPDFGIAGRNSFGSGFRPFLRPPLSLKDAAFAKLRGMECRNLRSPRI